MYCSLSLSFSFSFSSSFYLLFLSPLSLSSSGRGGRGTAEHGLDSVLIAEEVKRKSEYLSLEAWKGVPANGKPSEWVPKNVHTKSFIFTSCLP